MSADAATPPAAAAAAPLSPEACAAELKQRFPALFSGAPRPIKLRIQQDIQQRAPGVFTRQVLSGFLRRHTGSTAYLVALGKATQRFDLDGEPAGEISAEHHAAAAEELQRRRALRREREQAAIAAQRAQHEAARQAEREQRQQDEQGRRDRATLLRAFETSPLTKANFCALKGLSAEQLDAQLTQARQEAEAWARQRHDQRPEASPGPGRHAPGTARSGAGGDTRGERRPPHGPRNNRGPGPGTRPGGPRPPRQDGSR
ncbi:ProQ/FinO family protein [Pseudorhodoferax sp.]|uniref:ProQ/FinO family protein n=1 Tax=Pseudorhodoferax sp. TaxID=1993553 RepID=UPI002DD69D7E|nr:ProQ/FinO family protein [Pseudorhodoferax sp.]